MSDQNDHDDAREEHGHAPHFGGMHDLGGHDEEHEGAPEWLISFADMVMLIMGFFVILYALNATPPAKAGAEGASDGDTAATVPFDRWAEFVWNTRKAFGNPIDLNTTDPKLKEIVDWYKSEGPGRADQEGEVGDHADTYSPRESGQQSAMVEITFSHDTESLGDAARASIERVAEQIRGLPTMIEIHGHASHAEASRDVQAGLDLSYQRARMVAKALVDNGIPWKRIQIVAAGHHDPIQGHPDDAGDDAQNRRVELRLTDRLAVEEVRMESALDGR
ncbi:MAG: OmpA family protein [Phycisphaerales bacterium]|nr:OmpA family protein [Phycisphaerales bacterium]